VTHAIWKARKERGPAEHRGDVPVRNLSFGITGAANTAA